MIKMFNVQFLKIDRCLNVTVVNRACPSLDEGSHKIQGQSLEYLLPTLFRGLDLNMVHPAPLYF